MIKNSALSLHCMAEHDAQLYFILDVSTSQFIYRNKAFLDFFETVGNSDNINQLLHLIHPDDFDYLNNRYKEIAPGSFKNDIEFRIVLQQKVYHHKLTIFVEKEEPNVVCGRLADVTEQKLYEYKLLEFMNKKNAVLNIISHDLAGPLGSIQMLSTLLTHHLKEAKNEQVTKIISMIEANSKRGIKMIQEFIKKEFLESAGVELQKKRVNLVEIIEQIFSEYKSSELHLNINFAFDCGYTEIYVMIDEVKFMQAVNNLLSNAIKFTPDNGTVTLKLTKNEGKVLLAIADTGIGIPKKFHEKLFDKFNLAGRVGLRGEHSVGLGMSIIKTIIEWHKGSIWLESEEKQGTTFFIELTEC